MGRYLALGIIILAAAVMSSCEFVNFLSPAVGDGD